MRKKTQVIFGGQSQGLEGGFISTLKFHAMPYELIKNKKILLGWATAEMMMHQECDLALH